MEAVDHSVINLDISLHHDSRFDGIDRYHYATRHSSLQIEQCVRVEREQEEEEEVVVVEEEEEEEEEKKKRKKKRKRRREKEEEGVCMACLRSR